MKREINVEEMKDGKMLSNRSCTDCVFIFIFGIFAAGWVVIAVLAFQKGNPTRIILPTNYAGDLCGDTVAPYTRDNPFLFVPKPSRMGYGFCVPQCPQMFDYVCNPEIEIQFGYQRTRVRNQNYSHTSGEYVAGLGASIECPTRSAPMCPSEARFVQSLRFQGLLQKISEHKCFLVFYTSGSTLKRCLPFQPERGNLTLAYQAGESLESLNTLSEYMNAGSFFVRGFGEVTKAWIPIAITLFTGAVISGVWLILMRWILRPLAYTCVVLVLALLLGIAVMCKALADDLEAVRLPGEQGTAYQVQIWRAGQYVFFIASGTYVFVAIWLIKRIRIAMELMIEGSKAFISSPFMVAVPFVVLVGVVFVAAFSGVLMAYIQTIGSLDNGDFEIAASSTFGGNVVNGTIAAVNSNKSVLVNVTQWSTPNVIKVLHLYNLFGFLWLSNFFVGFGFFVVATTTSVYYFSVTQLEVTLMESDDKRSSDQGREKFTPLGTLPRAFVIALRYHIGSILFGSLLIALIQFIRAVVLYIQREVLEKIKDNPAVKFLFCIINCCLACCENGIKIISTNAYILIAITNCNFCTGATKATGILVNNILRVGTLTTMSAAVCFALKVFITISNTLIGYALIHQSSLTNGTIESGLFPMFCIFVMSFIIATLFISVYESCVDTITMCFFFDEQEPALAGAFMPPTLAKLVGMFTEVEKARRVYEDHLSGIASGKGPQGAHSVARAWEPEDTKSPKVQMT